MRHGVKICYINKDKRILLLHRDANAPTDPQTWTPPGGGVNDGETAEEAAKRESEEEIGYTPDKLEKIAEAQTELLKFTLYYSPIDKNLEDLKLGEGDGMEFFSFEEAYNLPIGLLARMSLDLARQHLEDSQTKSL